MVKSRKPVPADAEVKTLSDFALFLQHTKGLSKKDSSKMALECTNDPLYLELLDRNIEYLATGCIII